LAAQYRAAQPTPAVVEGLITAAYGVLRSLQTKTVANQPVTVCGGNQNVSPVSTQNYPFSKLNLKTKSHELFLCGGTLSASAVPADAAGEQHQGADPVREPANVDVGKCNRLAALEAVRHADDQTFRLCARNRDAAVGDPHANLPSNLAQAAGCKSIRSGTVPVLHRLVDLLDTG
uniref:Uncharacterized protein n=1 Tax=Anopheles coluzzii TaxID=1518534 RepID=A0A8W7P0X3_ANOCL